MAYFNGLPNYAPAFVTIFILSITAGLVAAQGYAKVGCFKAKPLAWSKTTYTLPKDKSTPNPTNCANLCGFNRGKNVEHSPFPLPLFSVVKGGCLCGALVPNKADQARDSDCQKASSSKSPSHVTVYVLHDVAKERSCRVVNYGMKDFDVAYNAHRASWSNGGKRVTYTMAGSSGTRINTRELYRYGLAFVTMKADPTPGAVTTFYLSDDLYEHHRCQHEIDIEIINAVPCTEGQCLWLNHYNGGCCDSGNTWKLNRTVVSKRIKASTFAVSKWNTYVIWWQPNFICTYVNGAKIHCSLQKKAPHNIPTHPMRIQTSMWSNCVNWVKAFAQWGGYWGGCVGNPNKITTSSLENMGRVVCSQPLKSQYGSGRCKG